MRCPDDALSRMALLRSELCRAFLADDLPAFAAASQEIETMLTQQAEPARCPTCAAPFRAFHGRRYCSAPCQRKAAYCRRGSAA